MSRVLSKSGVMDLIASILRELYEKDEPDWPENILEYLLHSFIERIPIVKQMELMVKNFEKQVSSISIFRTKESHHFPIWFGSLLKRHLLSVEYLDYN